MPVIGIDQVPREIVRPTWYSDYGYGQGKLLHDAILAFLSKGSGIGQVPATPTPGNSGQLTFPSGATTRTSPGELTQIRAMGGVPTTQGMVPLQPGGVTYQPPTRWGIRPDVDYQLQQQKLQTEQANQRFYDAYAQSLKPWNQSSTPPEPSPSPFHQQLSTLNQQAEAGDEQAVRKLRLILQLLNQP